MSEVKRYRCDWDGKQLFQEVHNTGEYVLYSDYEKLKAQLEKAEAVLTKIQWLGHQERKDYFAQQGFSFELYRCHSCSSAEIAYEYFKEKEQV